MSICLVVSVNANKFYWLIWGSSRKQVPFLNVFAHGVFGTSQDLFHRKLSSAFEETVASDFIHFTLILVYEFRDSDWKTTLIKLHKVLRVEMRCEKDVVTFNEIEMYIFRNLVSSMEWFLSAIPTISFTMTLGILKIPVLPQAGSLFLFRANHPWILLCPPFGMLLDIKLTKKFTASGSSSYPLSVSQR